MALPPTTGALRFDPAGPLSAPGGGRVPFQYHPSAPTEINWGEAPVHLDGVRLSGDRHRGTNPDRLLSRAWWRQPYGTQKSQERADYSDLVHGNGLPPELMAAMLRRFLDQ